MTASSWGVLFSIRETLTPAAVCLTDGAVRLIPDSSFRDNRNLAEVVTAIVLKIDSRLYRSALRRL